MLSHQQKFAPEYLLSFVGEDFFLHGNHLVLSAKLIDDPSGAKVLRDFTYENNTDPALCLVKLMTDRIRNFLSDGSEDIKLVVIPGVFVKEFETATTETHEGNSAFVYQIQATPRAVQVYDTNLFAAKKLKADDEVLAYLQGHCARTIRKSIIYYQQQLSNTIVYSEQQKCRYIINKCRCAQSALNIILDDNASNRLITDEQWKAILSVVKKEKAVVEYLEKCKQSLSTPADSLSVEKKM